MDQSPEDTDGGQLGAWSVMEASLALDSDGSRIAQARHLAAVFLARVRDARGIPVVTATVEIVQLIVSELVTNARKYAPVRLYCICGSMAACCRSSCGTAALCCRPPRPRTPPASASTAWRSSPLLPSPSPSSRHRSASASSPTSSSAQAPPWAPDSRTRLRCRCSDDERTSPDRSGVHIPAPDVLPGLKSRDSGLGRLTLPGASCFNALCGHVCPSYRHSAGVSRLHPSGGDDSASFEQDVTCCIVVTAVDGMALATRPLPDVQGLAAVPESAGRADLRGREGPVHLGEGTAVLDRLVLQHADERGPSRVVHGLGEPGAPKAGRVGVSDSLLRLR